MELPSPQELEELANYAATSNIPNDSHNSTVATATTGKVPMLPSNVHGTTSSSTAPTIKTFLPSIWSGKGSSRIETPSSPQSNPPPLPVQQERFSPNSSKHASAGPLDQWIQKAFLAFQSNPTTTKEKVTVGQDLSSSSSSSSSLKQGQEQEVLSKSNLETGIHLATTDRKTAFVETKPQAMDFMTNHDDNDDDEINNEVGVLPSSNENKQDAWQVSREIEDSWSLNNGQDPSLDLTKENETVGILNDSNVTNDHDIDAGDESTDNANEENKNTSGGGESVRSLTDQDIIMCTTEEADHAVVSAFDGHQVANGAVDNVTTEKTANANEESKNSYGKDESINSVNRKDAIVCSTDEAHDAVVGAFDTNQGEKDVVDATAEKKTNDMSDGNETLHVTKCQDPIMVCDTKKDDDIVSLSHDNGKTFHEDNVNVSGGSDTSDVLNRQDPIVESTGVDNNDDATVVTTDTLNDALDVVDASTDNVDTFHIEYKNVSSGFEALDVNRQDPIVGSTEADNDDGADATNIDVDTFYEENKGASEGDDTLDVSTHLDPIVGSTEADNDDDDAAVGTPDAINNALDVVDTTNYMGDTFHKENKGALEEVDTSTRQDPKVGSTEADNDDDTVGTPGAISDALDVVYASTDNGDTFHIKGEDDSRGVNTSAASTHQDAIVHGDDTDIGTPDATDNALDVVDASIENVAHFHEEDKDVSGGVDTSELSSCHDPIVGLTGADDVDDAVGTPGSINCPINIVDVSTDNGGTSRKEDKDVVEGVNTSNLSSRQDPIVRSTVADIDDAVCTSDVSRGSNGLVDATVDNGDTSREEDKDISEGVNTSDVLSGQDPIVRSAKADNEDAVGSSDAIHCVIDVVDASTDKFNGNKGSLTHISMTGETSRDTTRQDSTVVAMNADDDDVGVSNVHTFADDEVRGHIDDIHTNSSHLSSDEPINDALSSNEDNQTTTYVTESVEISRDTQEVINSKETIQLDTKTKAEDVSSTKSGARPVSTPDRKHSLRNRFVNWRSKADAVLQNNQVFQLAQRNLEETNKKLQQVVENTNIGNLSTTTGVYFRSPRKDANAENNDRQENAHDEKCAPSFDDDLSYDSTGGKSSSDDSSEGSSVFADSSDGESYSSSLSDNSSIYANGFSMRRIKDNSASKQTPRATAMLSEPDSVLSKPTALPSTDVGEEDTAKYQLGVTPTKSNITGRSGNSNNLMGDSSLVDGVPSTISPVTSYKGRYEPSSLRDVNREHVLRQIKRKVRSPSPAQSIDSAKTANDKTEQKYESQTSLLLKSIPAAKMKELAEALSPGQYLMVLRPGMLGVNLKQTFLPGYGVYVDHILPGGNAEKSGVIRIGDSLVKVGNVDVSKGTIYDVPGIIAGAKRPAIIILNGEHEIEVEDMDYLSVAFGLVNKIVNEAALGVSKSPTIDIPMEPESCDVSIMYDPPPEKLCIEVQNWSKRRNNSKAAFSIIKATFKQDLNLQKVFRKAFRICCLDNRRLPFFASFLTNDDAFYDGGERTDLVSASTSLMLYLELVSFQSVFSFASRKRIADHARLIAHKFLVRTESIEPLFDLRPLFPQELIDDLQEKLNKKSGEINRALFRSIEVHLEITLVGTKFASFLLSDECARMRAYMRGTVSFIDPPLDSIIGHLSPIASQVNVSACNLLRFMVVYLLCQKENDALDKNFDNKTAIASQETKRSIGSAGGLSCSIFILRTLQPLLNEASKTPQHDKEKDVISKLISALEDFWDFFVAPRGGILDSCSYSNETNDLIEHIREALVKSVESCHIVDREKKLEAIVRSLLQDGQFSENLSRLRDDLLFDYHINHHSKYKAHAIHEWMCAEASQTSKIMCENERDNDGHTFTLNLRGNSVSRLFRKLDIPKGVSRHRPAHAILDSAKMENNIGDAKCNINADFAIIFSARNYDVESDENATVTNNDFPVFDRLGFRRSVTASISEHGKNISERMPLEQIFPVTMVSYAMIPPLKDRSFKESIDFGRKIKNGWEVSLVNFMAPNNANKNSNDQANQFFYGVTLVLNQIGNHSDKKEVMKAIAISLVAERNVIPAMRSSLMKLYEEKVLLKANDKDCSSFVSSLKKLEADSDSSTSLSVLLEPYLKMGSSPWVDQTLTKQAKFFERSSLEFLVESLSPVPLSLLFLTTLLEQKIVVTSQRRSALVSFIVGMQSLLSPMSWPHLIVPTVPTSLANDLVQYPAPFIIGIPLDNKEGMDLLKALPDDVTLVDVDAGRVILTKRFLHHSDASDKKNDQQLNSVAIRSQVLLLAETLGNVLGVYQSDSVWRCDSPLIDSHVHVESSRKIEAAQKIARSFIQELTSGLNTCCYWIQEEVNETDVKTEQNILFDEDRFLLLKELRSQDQYFSLFESEDLAMIGHESSITHAPILSLTMTDFNLVIETFLRGQMMSSFVSSQDKRTMPFW